MPAFETNICNGALGRIGVARIGSIDDTSASAKWCKELLPQVRRRFLEMHHWTFAAWRDELSKDTSHTPEFEFNKAYILPADYIKLRQYNGAIVDLSSLDPIYRSQLASWFQVEGGYLYSNDGEVKIVYTRDVENPALWTPSFFEVVKVALASELAVAVRKDENKAGSLMSEVMQVLLPMAAATDSQSAPVAAYQVDDLIWGRQ